MPDSKERPLRMFFCYSHKDEILRDKVATALAVLKRTGDISGWHDRRIGAGTEWKNVIDEHLNAADIILLLVSPDFVDSDYCWNKEAARALQRHKAGEARVIPVILRATDSWQRTPFGELQGAPKDGKPVTSWPNEDEALADVASHIGRVVEELCSESGGIRDSESEQERRERLERERLERERLEHARLERERPERERREREEREAEQKRKEEQKQKRKRRRVIGWSISAILVVTAVIAVVVWQQCAPSPSDQTVTVPPVVGMNMRDAEAEVSKLGLPWRLKDTVYSEVDSGNIVSIEPTSGHRVKRGDTVNATVAWGKETCPKCRRHRTWRPPHICPPGPPEHLRVTLDIGRDTYKVDDTMMLTVWANMECYVYLVEFGPGDRVARHVPIPADKVNHILADHNYLVPADLGRGVPIKVGPPLGTDVFWLFAFTEELDAQFQSSLDGSPTNAGRLDAIRALGRAKTFAEDSEAYTILPKSNP